MSVVDGSFDHPLKIEEAASAPMAGGILQYGYQCGMLWGAVLAAGAQAYRLHGPGAQAEMKAVIAARSLVESFRPVAKGEIDCFEISKLNLHGQADALPILKFFLKGGPVGCFRMAARYAPVAFRETDAALDDNGPTEIPSPPVSCAAVLAERLGASDLHTVMAAGLAGGIGLSGGACGVLGAAIWFLEMKNIRAGVKNTGLAPAGAEEVVERFLASSDYEFECSKIAGCRFESVADHARYLRQGGCAHILEALSAG